MANGWTPERQVRAARLIRQWLPRERSTGRKMPVGKHRSAMRGYKGAVRLKLRAPARALREQQDVLEPIGSVTMRAAPRLWEDLLMTAQK